MLYLPAALTARIVRCASGANCTTVLQSAIDAGGDLEVQGTFDVTPIFLRSSNQLITFAPGSVVQAQRGSFRNVGDCLFIADGAYNLTIIGYGAKWIMRKADYHNSSLYTPSEDRHGLSLISCTDVRVLGLEIGQTGGDGVYMARNVNVMLRDVTVDGAYRSALTLVSGRDLLFAGCRFLRTSGTWPEGGIDIEPNPPKPGQTLELTNISFVDLECRQNVGTALSFSLGKVPAEVVADFRVENALIEGCSKGCTGLDGPVTGDRLDYNVGVFMGGRVEAGPDEVRSSVRLANVSVSHTVQPGLELFDKSPAGYTATLERMRFEDVGTAPLVRWGGKNVPLLLHQSAPRAAGGFRFINNTVIDAQERPFFRCDSCARRGAATNMSGSFTVVNPSSEGCALDLANTTNVSIHVECRSGSSRGGHAR